jgi:hypothetical protein
MPKPGDLSVLGLRLNHHLTRRDRCQLSSSRGALSGGGHGSAAGGTVSSASAVNGAETLRKGGQLFDSDADPFLAALRVGGFRNLLLGILVESQAHGFSTSECDVRHGSVSEDD